MKYQLAIAAAAAAALCGCSGKNGNQQALAGAGTGDEKPAITIVGCLVPGGAGSPSATVGTSGSTAAAGFTLIDTTSTGTATSDTGAASGAAGTSGSATVDTGTPRSYNLVGGNQDELRKYLNSRVEVRGAAIASTDTGAGVPDVAAAAQPAGTPATAVQQVRVDHVRQLDVSCSPASNR